jgi:hypothetical protein
VQPFTQPSPVLRRAVLHLFFIDRFCNFSMFSK